MLIIFTGTDKKDIKKEWDSQFDPIVGMIGGYGVEYFLLSNFLWAVKSQ